jgi:hypothetical protein
MRATVLVALALLGCKGKPQHREAPANSSTPVELGSNMGARPDLSLPHGPGTPPLRTTGPISQDAIKRMRAMTFDRFTTENRGHDQSIVMASETTDHPKITVTVQIRPCTDQCRPMQLDKWNDPSVAPTLKEFMAKPLRTAADLQFDIGNTELDGEPMIYTYQLGQTAGENGGATYTDAYVLYFNDGHNEIRAIAAYTGDPLGSKAALAERVPKDDLEHVAKAFVDVYTHAWTP